MGDSIINCGRCGRTIWEVEVCPKCGATQSEWNEGEPVNPTPEDDVRCIGVGCGWQGKRKEAGFGHNDFYCPKCGKEGYIMSVYTSDEEGVWGVG